MSCTPDTFHVRPANGWLNDPNGPIFDRVAHMYHMFFQHNPAPTCQWDWAIEVSCTLQSFHAKLPVRNALLRESLLRACSGVTWSQKMGSGGEGCRLPSNQVPVSCIVPGACFVYCFVYLYGNVTSKMGGNAGGAASHSLYISPSCHHNELFVCT